MKVFISADIEGISTTTCWDDTENDKAPYKYHALQMTKEVLAACNGAISAGAKEIFVKDAHGYAMNIDTTMLPDCVKVHRRWSGHPYSMVEGIDKSFDACVFIGYHSASYQDGNPLAHTMTGKIQYIKINNQITSEFMIFSYAAALENVPTVFLSGDKNLCDYSTINPAHPKLITLAVKEGIGASTINYPPNLMLKKIEEGVSASLKQDLKNACVKLPEKFNVEVCYKTNSSADKASYYPGVKRVDPYTVSFKSKNYFDVLTTFKFILLLQ